MTDSMNFGPEWLRNLSSEGPSGGGAGISRYQLAEYRYGREEMLALYEKGLRPPESLINFPIFSDQSLPPLALTPATEEERTWSTRTVPINPGRGRGSSLERGRGGRGRGAYQTYGRSAGYDATGSWGNGEQTEWSPRKDFNSRSASVDNWRRHRTGEEDDGWRSVNAPRGNMEKWGRSTSWREGDVGEERNGPPERTSKGWQEGSRGHLPRRSWDEENLPEWATENLAEGGGTFDATGAFHGSDDEQQPENKNNVKRDVHLQKSVSQHNIHSRIQSSSLTSSKSAISLSKPPDNEKKYQEQVPDEKLEDSVIPDETNNVNQKIELFSKDSTEKQKMKTELEELPKVKEKPSTINNTNGYAQEDNACLNINRVEEDFDKLQEDLVLKLVVDEEVPKGPKLGNVNYDVNIPQATQPPPNLAAPVQDKWYYQDPQGDTQGPFLRSEMADWYRHGYFQLTLMVRRQCDDRFYMLADLIKLCNVENPFESNLRINPVKALDGLKMQEQDALQYQLLQQQFALRQATARALSQTEPWTSLSPLQQKDLIAQHMLSQQMNPNIQYLQQPQQPNPLMHMINQMQQANKLPGTTLPEKPPNQQIPSALDPIQALVQQMGGLQSLQNRLTGGVTGLPAPGGIPNTLPTGLPATLSSDLPGLQSTPLPGGGLGISNLQAGISPQLGVGGILPGSLPPRPTPLGAVDPLTSTENDPIKSLLRQLQNQKQQQQQQTQQLDSLWHQNQFPTPQPNPPHWQPQPEAPISMWDMQPPTSNTIPAVAPTEPQPSLLPSVIKPTKQEMEQVKQKDEQTVVKEQKKKKEQDEKQQKKELEEKKKLEQKRQEAEKRAVEEKRKKEEERIRRELERAKKEAEEKRMRELEEKRRLKEQRKAEDARRKSEEQRREEEEKAKREAKEYEEQARKQVEQTSKQTQENIRLSKIAPWSQSGASSGASLEEIQKAEKQKRAEQAALMQQRAQQQQEMQQAIEKSNPVQFKWANRPMEPRKVKSLAEIQAEEEHERLAKQMAEARLMQQKEKEIPTVPTASIWSGQNLTWANNSSHWSNSTGGFWDEISVNQKTSPTKPSSVVKSVSTSAVNSATNKQSQKQSKSKAKKEEQQVMKVFNNGPVSDEFTEWCMRALKDINSAVDVPTFITFLRDIESAMDVREYCKEYLGEGSITHQFANEFLEKRRSYRPRSNAHKDDMCSPAPALTPSTQHSTEFQEVKGKSKKSKKSKMTKVDSRILGFNVTAAQDRINIGDLDRVDI